MRFPGESIYDTHEKVFCVNVDFCVTPKNNSNFVVGFSYEPSSYRTMLPTNHATVQGLNPGVAKKVYRLYLQCRSQDRQ